MFCPCCGDEEEVEYVPNAQSYRCNFCSCHFSILALYEIHYFIDGTVHRKENGICYPLPLARR